MGAALGCHERGRCPPPSARPATNNRDPCLDSHRSGPHGPSFAPAPLNFFFRIGAAELRARRRRDSMKGIILGDNHVWLKEYRGTSHGGYDVPQFFRL